MDRLAGILRRLLLLEDKLKSLEERVSVMEENTCDHESRLEDLETWQEKVDDELDEY